MRIYLLNFFVCTILCYTSSFSQEINIGLFQNKTSKKIFIEANSGKYKIKSGNKTIYRLKQGRAILVNKSNGFLKISNTKKDIGLYKECEIISKKYKYNRKRRTRSLKKNNELNIKLIDPKQIAKTYQGNLKIALANKEIKIVNRIDFPEYLAGVVEAESGSRCEEEYYKSQAIICRTYALKTHEKHKTEGFDLCDGVHCQAYKGKSNTNLLIQKAVVRTKNLVIVDEKEKLITSVFSANCGGQTNNSEDVWIAAVPHLKSIVDTFCVDQRQAFWTKTISAKDWKDFLKDKVVSISDTLHVDSFAFKQPERLKFYSVNGEQIKLTSLRYGFKLRSTFFEIKPKDENLEFSGRGYGHGVGMCQEGAMNMAKKGYKFEEIIKYYYFGVKIKSLKELPYKVPYQ